MKRADLFETDLTGSARKLWLCLVSRSDDSLRCAAPIGVYQADTGLSERTVQYLLEKLKFGGYVALERGGNGRGKCNTITLVSPVKGAKSAKKGCKEMSNEINETGHSAPIVSSQQAEFAPLSPKKDNLRDTPRAINREAALRARRKFVRDGYLSFIAYLGPDQYPTIPGLAKELCMKPEVVRRDLDHAFRNLDVPVELQLRLRKSERKWGRQKMGKPTTTHFDRFPDDE